MGGTSLYILFIKSSYLVFRSFVSMHIWVLSLSLSLSLTKLCMRELKLCCSSFVPLCGPIMRRLRERIVNNRGLCSESRSVPNLRIPTWVNKTKSFVFTFTFYFFQKLRGLTFSLNARASDHSILIQGPAYRHLRLKV